MTNVTGNILRLLSLLFLLLPHSANGADFPCNDINCLVAAIDEANTNGAQNTIVLAAGSYELFSVRRFLIVTTPLSLTIRGNGAENTLIVGHPLLDAPAFFVEAGAILNLDSLTITGSRGGLNSAGGIFNSGTLTVVNSKIDSNQVIEGAGGGIYNEGTAQILDSSITNNSAIDLAVPTLGGGIWNAGTAEIVNSTISNNTVVNGSGAGIANTGVLTIINSSIVGNEVESGSTASGGGISNFGTLRVTNSTVARNIAVAGTFGARQVSGGGIFNTGTVELQNTILALNTVGETAGASGPDCNGLLTSLGANLVGDLTDCGITLQADDLTGDPGLGDFVDEGFPGAGHLPLLPGSPAINVGHAGACPATDQLGNPRFGGCDIGAVELGGNGLQVSIDVRPNKDNDRINPNGTANINVAVFSGNVFDARTIDPLTVRFGKSGTEAAPINVARRDVNGDGARDLVFRFIIRDLGIQCGDSSAILTGQTTGGQAFRGSTPITTTRCKAKQ